MAREVKIDPIRAASNGILFSFFAAPTNLYKNTKRMVIITSGVMDIKPFTSILYKLGIRSLMLVNCSINLNIFVLKTLKNKSKVTQQI